MILQIVGHSFHYEMENLCRLFFPYEKICVVGLEAPELHTMEKGGLFASTLLRRLENGVLLETRLHFEGKESAASELVPPGQAVLEKELERRMAVLLFGLLAGACAYTPKWGILTGVRPIKLLRRLSGEMGEEAALRHFQKGFLVSPEKTELSRATMHKEEKLLACSRPESFSLYLSIPFCPTRCAYCSFVSSSVKQAARLMPEYVELLCHEVEAAGRVASALRLRLESVYVGGGTPTTLSAEQMARLLDTVGRSFDLAVCREFTVEAGRPDTITEEKLAVMRPRGVTRISINPQTLNDAVLERIGRRHTTAQTLEAFALARRMGFHDINMDLIAGLPGDSLESFQDTMDRIGALSPESVTVHALSLKKSAGMLENGMPDGAGSAFAAAELPARMIDYAEQILSKGGWAPYYLYRQSRMVGNLENTGWAKPGHESFYNVYIMDETHTILACGAGAVTKVRDPYSDRLVRIFNFKYPYEYNSRNGEILTRKEQVKTIYDEFGL